MVSPLTLLLCIVCGVVPLGPSRTAPMASKGLSGHVLMCAGAMGSLHAPPALCAAIGSFLAAGGGCLSPSSVVSAGAARLGADMAARLFPFSDLSGTSNVLTAEEWLVYERVDFGGTRGSQKLTPPSSARSIPKPAFVSDRPVGKSSISGRFLDFSLLNLKRR